MAIVWAAAVMAGAQPLPAVQVQAAAPAAEPALVADDSPEEIAKDAARDLKDTRFYNKPGATRAAYNADWQRCRLIARGSRTPAGTVPLFYNPAYISPLAAGIGGGIGGLIAGAIAQGQQRRDNRRSCLMIGGWRLVELPDAETAKIAAMTDEQRSAFFDTIVGASTVPGKVTELTRFSFAPDPALHPEAPLTTPGQVWFGKKVDPATPFVLAPGEAALVIGYRRVEAPAAGRSASVELARYDLSHRDLAYRPKDWKKTGDKTVYGVIADSKDKQASYEVQVLRVTPGDYVVKSFAVGKVPLTTSHCFGAPLIHVEAGEVAYLGDFIPYMDARLSTGGKMSGLVYASHPDDARRTLASSQPALAAQLKIALLRNGATYACNAITMTRWDIDGLETLPAAVETAQR